MALVDRERFRVGKPIEAQMDATQDQAEQHVLVLSPGYNESSYCTREMNRAIDTDPDFTRGAVLPVMRVDCEVPTPLKRPNLLYVDLRDDHRTTPWNDLLAACDADLGCDAPQWLDVRDEVRRKLAAGRSVNLVVSGEQIAWRALINQIGEASEAGMVRVDLNSAHTIERPGLLAAMLDENETAHILPRPPRDLSEFQRIVESRPLPSRIALLHFDQVQFRKYGTDYLTTLRYLVTEQRKLVLLIESRDPLVSLLKHDYRCLMSDLTIECVHLRGSR